MLVRNFESIRKWGLAESQRPVRKLSVISAIITGAVTLYFLYYRFKVLEDVLRFGEPRPPLPHHYMTMILVVAFFLAIRPLWRKQENRLISLLIALTIPVLVPAELLTGLLLGLPYLVLEIFRILVLIPLTWLFAYNVTLLFLA